MMGRRLLTTLAGTGLIAHGLAARKARQIQSAPDTLAYEDLCEEPEGEERFVARPDGTRIRVRAAGEGPAVAFAHGYGLTLLEWRLVWERLRELGWRCVAFDLRGHGQSTIGADGISSTAMAGDYEAVLRELDLRDAILVGHSTGSFLALRAILDLPELRARLRGLVAFASTAGDIMRGSPQNRLQLPMIRLGLMQKISRSPTYSWLFGASLCGQAPSPAAIRVFNEIFAAQAHARLAPIIEYLAKERLYERLGEIELPTVVVCGEEDRTTPRWHAELIGERIPGARNVWVPGKGHLLNWEAPESLVEAVESLRARSQ